MSVRYHTITHKEAGQRLDNFLIGFLKGVPKTHIYRLIRKGEVRINKKRADNTTRLGFGDSVRIPPVRVADAKEKTQASPDDIEALLGCILYEDEFLLVLNKPAGLAVHSGSGISQGLIERLRQAKPYAPFLELAHRLDRHTSGCLLIAKKRSVLLKLQAAWQEPSTQKFYHALVHGQWPKRLNKVDLALTTHERQDHKRQVQAKTEGKVSVTIFTREQVFPKASLVLAELRTGRMHQIRVHANASGHPIIGDSDYGNRDLDTALLGKRCPIMCLHASKLQLIHPMSGQKLNFTAPLPDSWQSVLAILKD